MPPAELRRNFLFCLEIAAVITALSLTAQAQEPVQQLTAPPPPKVIVKDERTQIDAEKNVKDRLKLTLQLAENHLLSAEQYTAQSSFEAANGEIGKYHALIDDLLKYLASQAQDKNKTRDMYKKIELALRSHGPRLTAMRRTTPLEYAVWIKEVEEFAREGRTEALNSFYGHTVVRENSPTKPDDNANLMDPKRKDNSLAPSKKP
jgi:hypothetical protein